MQVILLTPSRLGNIGEEVRVKDGYARNWLLPTGMAVRATDDNKEKFERQRAEILKENENRKKEAEKARNKVESKFINLIKQASEDGRLYGSVSKRDIAVALHEFDKTIDKSHVVLTTPIREIGVHKVILELHGEVSAEVLVVVAVSESQAKSLKADFEEETKKAKKASEDKENSVE